MNNSYNLLLTKKLLKVLYDEQVDMSLIQRNVEGMLKVVDLYLADSDIELEPVDYTNLRNVFWYLCMKDDGINRSVERTIISKKMISEIKQDSSKLKPILLKLKSNY